MSTTDRRIDEYITRAEPFARPVLRHIREVVHSVSPEIEETIKWKMPTFVKDGILCTMAAFKQHCSFSLWKGDLILGPDAASGEGMGQFGRITSIDDLPPADTLRDYVRKAIELNVAGEKSPRKAGVHPEAPLHESFRAALDRHPEARATFEGFSPSHRREYAEWIADAKREETRERRIAQALEWLAEGKPRNWKYEKRAKS